MLDIDLELEPASLQPRLDALWERSGPRIKQLCREHTPDSSTPVFTKDGTYTARGWTEWTEGFLYGWANGWSLEECARLGTHCATQVIQQVGARIPQGLLESFPGR